jgi:hypothetical protein
MSIFDKMRGWQSHIDSEIEKAIKDADKLPNAGKPLQLNRDENVPDENRMAYKILAENELAPEWIMQGKALERKEEKFRKALARAHADHASGRFANADTVWQSELRKLQQKIDKHNEEVLTYNLKVPRGVNHRRSFKLERELKKLDA